MTERPKASQNLNVVGRQAVSLGIVAQSVSTSSSANVVGRNMSKQTSHSVEFKLRWHLFYVPLGFRKWGAFSFLRNACSELVFDCSSTPPVLWQLSTQRQCPSVQRRQKGKRDPERGLQSWFRPPKPETRNRLWRLNFPRTDRNPKPETRNPKPTLKTYTFPNRSKPKTRNPKPETDSEDLTSPGPIETRNPKPTLKT